MERAYFVVEGPHDVEVVGRLLALHGLERVKWLADLDKFWTRLVPRTFPHQGDLMRRIPVPVFFASEGFSVAIHSAGGIGNIASVVEATFTALDEEPQGLGVLLDADDDDVKRRWETVVSALPTKDAGSAPGAVGQGTPRVGVYVLPDNDTAGTLEYLLVQCAEKAYPKLLKSAKAWIDPLDPNDESIFKNAKERGDFSKPAGKTKAIASCVASVLRPGKSIQVSIQDNQWLRHPEALELDVVKQLRRFIDAVLGVDRATEAQSSS